MTDVSVPQMRQCTKCKAEYPATTQYFTKGSGHSKDGLHSWCKACKKEDTAKRAHPLPPPGMMHTCRLCNRKLPATTEYFYKSNAHSIGLCSACKDCSRELDKQRPKRQRRRTTTKASDQQRASSPSKRKRAVADPAIREEKARLSGIVAKHRRRRRKEQVENSFNSGDWDRCLEYFNWCCAACGRQLADLFGSHTASADHWMPLRKGGATSRFNIIPLCHSKQKGVKGCNGAKSDKLPEEWLEKQFGSRKAQEIKSRIARYFDWLREQDSIL